MSEDSPSLKAFILGDPPNAALSQCVASVTAALGTSLFDVRHFDWSSLAGDISEKLEQMFDVRVTDILAAAWKDYQALIDCADPAKHSADETISLPCRSPRRDKPQAVPRNRCRRAATGPDHVRDHL
jgi:hypothetical protein